MEALFQKCLLSSPLMMSFYRIPPEKARIIIHGLSCHNSSMILSCKMRFRRSAVAAFHFDDSIPRRGATPAWVFCYFIGRRIGNVKKCAVGKHPKSEKHGNTAQFSEVERSGTQENCGGIGSGCRLRLHPLPVLRRRQSHRVACIDPDAVVVDKNIAKNDRFDLFSR